MTKSIKFSQKDVSLLYYKEIAKDYREEPSRKELIKYYKEVITSGILTYESYHFFMSEFARRNDKFTDVKLDGLSKYFFEGCLINKTKSIEIIKKIPSQEVINEICAFCYFISRDVDYLNFINFSFACKNNSLDWMLITNIVNEINDVQTENDNLV